MWWGAKNCSPWPSRLQGHLPGKPEKGQAERLQAGETLPESTHPDAKNIKTTRMMVHLQQIKKQKNTARERIARSNDWTFSKREGPLPSEYIRSLGWLIGSMFLQVYCCFNHSWMVDLQAGFHLYYWQHWFVCWNSLILRLESTLNWFLQGATGLDWI